MRSPHRASGHQTRPSGPGAPRSRADRGWLRAPSRRVSAGRNVYGCDEERARACWLPGGGGVPSHHRFPAGDYGLRACWGCAPDPVQWPRGRGRQSRAWKATATPQRGREHPRAGNSPPTSPDTHWPPDIASRPTTTDARWGHFKRLRRGHCKWLHPWWQAQLGLPQRVWRSVIVPGSTSAERASRASSVAIWRASSRWSGSSFIGLSLAVEAASVRILR